MAPPPRLSVRPADLALAIGLAAVAVLEGRSGVTDAPTSWALVPTAVACGAAVLVRRTPWGLAVVLACMLVQAVAGSDLPGGLAEPVALVVVLYGFVRASRPLDGLLALGVAAAGLTVVLLQGPVRLANFLFAGLLLLAAWAAGTAVRDADERGDLLAERRTVEERARIARELHDVVSHHVSAMVVRAASERRTLSEEDPAAPALLQIEEEGRETMRELRRLLGVLRAPHSEGEVAAPRQPLPGLADLPGLLHDVRRSGVEVAAEEHGEPFRMGDGEQLAVFRAVQECLTNARKHAPGQSVEVALRWEPQQLEVVVRNPVVDGGGPAVPGAGLGLRGMRERLTSYGGTLAAGEVGGQFQVRLVMPEEVSG